MLTSRTIRTLTLFVIGAVFLNIAVYMIWWFHFQQTGLRYNFRKIYDTDYDVVDITTLKNLEEEDTTSIVQSYASQLWPYTFSLDMSNISTSNDNHNLNYGTSTVESTVGDSGSTVVIVKKRKVRRVLCHEIPSRTGLMPVPLPANTSQVIRTLTVPGGHYKFVECRARQKIALLVTLRYGEVINETFFLHMHTFLIMQEAEYHFFVIAQNNTEQPFNRGRLFNVGFLEVRRRYKHIHCFVFHEPTVLPLDSKNLYRCTWYPRQLAAAIKTNDKITFYPKFGYAMALTTEQFSKANGFSNGPWMYNSGYDDLFNRLIAANYVIERSPAAHGNYFVINYDKVASSKKGTQLTTEKYPPLFDGLSTLSFTVACYEERDLYTYISVRFPEEYLSLKNTS